MPFYTSLINIDDILNDFSLFRSKYVKKHSNVPAKSDLCLGTRAQVPAISGGLINSSANILIYASVCNTFKTRLLLRLKLGRQQSCNSDIEERNHLESLSFPIQKTNVANIDLVEICEK